MFSGGKQRNQWHEIGWQSLKTDIINLVATT